MKRNLRSIIVLTVLAGLFVMSACDKVGRSAKFDLEYDATFTLQDTCQVGIEYDFFSNLGTNSQDTFALENTNNDLVKSIRMTELELSINAPQGYDFASLDTVKVYLSAPGFTNGEIASKTNIFQFATEIEFDSFLNTEYKPMVIKDELLFNLKVTFDNQPATDLQVNLHCKFHVEAEEVQD